MTSASRQIQSIFESTSVYHTTACLSIEKNVYIFSCSLAGKSRFILRHPTHTVLSSCPETPHRAFPDEAFRKARRVSWLWRLPDFGRYTPVRLDNHDDRV